MPKGAGRAGATRPPRGARARAAVPEAPADDSGDADLTGLVSFQLRQLANMYSRGAARVYKSRFGLTMNEWRVIALLHAGGELSLNRLARHGQLDAGLTSRLVTSLARRGLVARRVDEKDARGVALSLTREGRALVRRVLPVARERNDHLLACLTGEERSALLAILPKLTARALDMLAGAAGDEAGAGGRGSRRGA